MSEQGKDNAIMAAIIGLCLVGLMTTFVSCEKRRMDIESEQTARRIKEGYEFVPKDTWIKRNTSIEKP